MLLYRSALHNFCMPAMVACCIVCSPAVAAKAIEGSLDALRAELNLRYLDSSHWGRIQDYLDNMRRSGSANWTDQQGRNLLDFCLSELPGCDALLVHKILMAGLDPNHAAGATLRTPLHHAATNNDYRMALRLMAFGASTDVKDKDGLRPVDMTRHPQLRVLLRRGYPVELQSEEALEAWEKARQGDAAAMWELSGYYNDDTGIHSTYMSKWAKAEQGSDVDEREKTAWVEQAAARGVAAAQYDLGLRLLFGKGVPQDAAKGRALIRAAATQGLESAATFLRENPAPES